MNAAAAPQSDPAGEWYAIVDTAQDSLLAGLVRQCAGWQCLIGGDLVPELAATMPYLVRWNPDEPLAVAWRTRGVGAHWGILFQSPQTLDMLRTQFKKFLQAMLPDGTTALFRFYDPRVFRDLYPRRFDAPKSKRHGFDGIDSGLFGRKRSTPGAVSPISPSR